MSFAYKRRTEDNGESEQLIRLYKLNPVFRIIIPPKGTPSSADSRRGPLSSRAFILRVEGREQYRRRGR
jgi:hypothetical protein